MDGNRSIGFFMYRYTVHLTSEGWENGDVRRTIKRK